MKFLLRKNHSVVVSTKMKLFILFSLVALCFSQSTYVGRRVTVGSDGLITIVGEQGREIDIYRRVLDPRKIDIVLKSFNGPSRKIEVDEVNNVKTVEFDSNDVKVLSYLKNLGRDFSQHDVLVQFFKQYQGLIDSVRYEKLLETLRYLVQKGLVHETIWNVLRYFNDITAQDYQEWSNDKYVPRREEYDVGQYGLEDFQKRSPLQRLSFALQQRKSKQGVDEEWYPQQFTQQYYSENQNDQFQSNPWTKFLTKERDQQSAYPEERSYQTPWAREQRYNYQQEQPQGYYYQNQQEFPQQWWNSQQRYNRYPQGEKYQQEYPQQWWNSQQKYNRHSQGVNQQQEYPQQWWNSQQRYNRYSQGVNSQQGYPQQWWNTQQRYNRYPQGENYEQEYPQQWWNSQQRYNRYPQGQENQREYPQQWWNSEQRYNRYPQGENNQREYSQQWWNSEQRYNRYPQGENYQPEYARQW